MIYYMKYELIRKEAIALFELPKGISEDLFNRITIQAVIDNIDEVIALVDSEKIVRVMNKEACRMLKELADLDPPDLIGHPVDEVLAPLIFDSISVVALAVETKVPLQKNIRYILESKSIDKTILYSAMPIMIDDQLLCVVATGRDMTKLLQLEERLAASEKLNQYYYSVVHDLTESDFGEPIIFSSKVMEDTLKLAIRTSQSDATVLITGESGVGKEEIAKYIHRNSMRNEKPYITINCAAIPKELIESELFGYVEGAFTGSRKGGKRGILEEVDGGTLFLDEIGELPIELQSKFLRVLQDGSVRRIGANRDTKVDVRYISATNLPYKSLLDNNHFRQDLLYRLSVIPISVPPIRERREDIIPLIEYFLSVYNLKYDRNVQLTAAVYAHMCTLPWRGNVRQIKNMIERIVILSEDGSLMLDDLIPILQLDIFSSESEHPTPARSVHVTELTTLSAAQDEMEKQLIDMALKAHESIPKAAKALGVPPSTIYRKLKK